MRKAVGLQQANTVSAPPMVYLKGVWKQPSQHQFCWLSAGANTSLPSPQHPVKWSPSASPAHTYPTRGSHSMGRDTQNKKHSPRWCWASQGGDDMAPSIYVYTDGITFLALHQKKTFPFLLYLPTTSILLMSSASAALLWSRQWSLIWGRTSHHNVLRDMWCSHLRSCSSNGDLASCWSNTTTRYLTGWTHRITKTGKSTEAQLQRARWRTDRLGKESWEANNDEVRLATNGMRSWNLLDKKRESGPNARAWGTSSHLSCKATTSKRVQDMI